MPVKMWSNGAVLIYKGARVIVPALIAATGAAIGYALAKKEQTRPPLSPR